MRVSLNELILFAAPMLCIAYSLINYPQLRTGVFLGSLSAAALITALAMRGWSGWRPYTPLLITWLLTYVASALTGNYALAGASASFIVTGLTLLRVLGLETSYGGALISLAITLLSGEGLVESGIAGVPFSKYLTYALSAGLSRWFSPPLLIRVGYAVSVTYLLTKYLLPAKEGLSRQVMAALIAGAAWSLITLILITLSSRSNAALISLIMTMAPLLVFTVALRVASE